ncbi:MAG: Ldh family oxidoreductase [Actinomycetota bacterium]
MTTAASIAAEDVVIVDAGALVRTIVDALVANGASPTDATTQAEILAEGDLRGHHSHGVRRLPVLVNRLKKGLIATDAQPVWEWRTDSVLEVDGRRGFGPSVAFASIDKIIERAASTGIAVVTISNSNHVGMLAPYIERITAAGQVAFGFTTSEALVHPWGSARALVGTNPIGIGVPNGDEPLVLDMSTASVSMGKILEHAARGEAIPLGWAVDVEGNQTTDAAAAAQGGAISPFGGPKGYGLGIALEAVVGLLTRSSFGIAVHGTLDSDRVATKGDVFIAVSLERLGLTGSLPGMREYFDEVRASGPNAGDVTVPGDRARATRARRLRDGVPLHVGSWQQALVLGKGGAVSE